MSGHAAQVRPVTAFDVALLAEMHAAIFTAPWDRSWSAESLAQTLSVPGARGWLLEQAEAPLGFALARFTLDEGEILLTGILPAARGQGHGVQLMQAVIDAARGAGLAALFLEHAEPNVAAARLYSTLGFAETGRRRDYYGDKFHPGRHFDAVTRALHLAAAEPSRAARIDPGMK